MTPFIVGLCGKMLAWCGSTASRRLLQAASILPQIERAGQDLRKLPDEALRRRSLSLRYRVRSGEPPARILVEAYSLAIEAARRTLQLQLHPVQILGAIVMHRGCIAEMEAEIEMIRALTWRACAELPDGPQATKLSSSAKLAGGNMAVRVTNLSIEMLGGSGYLESGLAEKLFRDAKLLQIYEGPPAIQKMLIADTVTRLSWVGH